MKYWIRNFGSISMKNDVFSREFDKLVEGRMKKLSGIDLREELDSRENVSVMSSQDGDEVFGE